MLIACIHDGNLGKIKVKNQRYTFLRFSWLKTIGKITIRLEDKHFIVCEMLKQEFLSSLNLNSSIL